MPPQRRSSLSVGLAALVAWLIVITSLATTIVVSSFRERTAALAAADERLGSATELLAQHVSRMLGGANLFVSQHLLGFGEAEVALDGFARALFRAHASSVRDLPQILAFAVVDETGVVRHSTDPANVGIVVADRPYFVVQRDGAAGGMYINDPVVSRVPPHPRVIPVSWPLRSRDRGFAGVVMATLSGPYFARYFDAAVQGEHGFVALTDAAGAVLMRDTRRWAGGGLPPSRLPLPPRSAAGEVGHLMEAEIGAERTAWRIAAEPVPDTKLLIVTGAARDEVLAGWRLRALVGGGALVAVALVLGAMAAALARYAARQEAALGLAHAAQQRAEEADRAKSQFLATMSHEIRTPMTALLGMAGLLAADEDLTDRQRRYLKAIRASGEQLLAIINDILDFFRFGAGGVQLEAADFRLADVLEDVASVLTPPAVEKGLALGVDSDEGLPPALRGDPTRLKQVLFNLVGNALKFTHRGGVTVAVRRRPEGEVDDLVRLRVEVRDTGVGMTPEQMARLFQPFTQADSSTARVYGGTGLGLAISKRLVEAMGGAIGVESEPGRGSLFWFEVPLGVGGAPAPTVGREGAAHGATATGPLRVLLAEDAPLNQELVTEVLGRYGHEVVVAADGREAVERAAGGGFDLVLMDMQMPFVDGIEATRRIRALPPPAGRVPVIGLTANVMERDRQACIRAGMDECLGKPIEWTRLLTAMAHHGGPGRRIVQPGPSPDVCEVGGAPRVPLSNAERSEAPLLDRAMIERLATRLPGAAFAGLLGRAVGSAGRACERLAALRAGSEELSREAHTLKGSAGSFGLSRISAVAEEIEAAAREGRDASEGVERLAAAVAATREELRRSGLIPG